MPEMGPDRAATGGTSSQSTAFLPLSQVLEEEFVALHGPLPGGPLGATADPLPALYEAIHALPEKRATFDRISDELQAAKANGHQGGDAEAVNRALLPPTRCQAQDILAGQVGQPFMRHGLRRRQLPCSRCSARGRGSRDCSSRPPTACWWQARSSTPPAWSRA